MIDAQKIWSSSKLPTLPAIAVRLLELSRDPNVESRQILDCVRKDPAISAKILKATNSSLFGFSSPVTAIERALPLLGTRVVTSLALSFSLVEDSMPNGPLAKRYKEYWIQSIVQAGAAETLGKISHPEQASEYFLTALLMDLGRLAMLKTIPLEYQAVLDKAHDSLAEVHQVEQENLGFDHVFVAIRMMETWKLPEMLTKAVRHHHAPISVLDEMANDPDFHLVKGVAVAAAVGDVFCSPNNKGPALERLRALTTRFYNFTEESLAGFLEAAKTKIDATATLFPVNAEQIPSPSDMMAEAIQNLAEMAVSAEVASARATARNDAMELENKSLESKNEELKKQSLYDSLTKVYNRQFFDDSLEKEISRCSRTGSSIGIIFLDIDNFKKLNDTYGHQFGDVVLEQVAKACGETLRKSDILARYGGEEFVFLLVQPTEGGLALVANRIRARIESEKILFEGKPVPVTASLGAVFSIPRRNDPDLEKRLVNEADDAMYESKRNGRNRVTIRSVASPAELRLAKNSANLRFSQWLMDQNLFDHTTITNVISNCKQCHRKFGELAQQYGYLASHQLDQVLREQSSSHYRCGEIAIQMGLLDETHLAFLLAVQQEDPDQLASRLVSQGLLEQPIATELLQQFFSATKPKPLANPKTTATV